MWTGVKGGSEKDQELLTCDRATRARSLVDHGFELLVRKLPVFRVVVETQDTARRGNLDAPGSTAYPVPIRVSNLTIQ